MINNDKGVSWHVVHVRGIIGAVICRVVGGGIFDCAFTFVEPRVPSLKGKMKAKKAEIITFSAADIGADLACIGLPGSPTKVVDVFPPPARADHAVLEGTIDEQIDQLVDKLVPYLKEYRTIVIC